MKYYIAENGQQSGPFEPSELLAHGLTVNSLVWCEGMANWTSASQVPELMALLSGQIVNPGNIDTQLPQMPPMGGQTQLPQTPPFNPQQPTQPTTYGTPNQPYAPPQYGPSTNQPQNMMPKTWLTESIIATVVCSLCCGASLLIKVITLLAGVYAIFQANGVKTKFNMGDYAGANKKSASAKMWMLITVGLGLVASLYSAYLLLSNPELLQQIQEGSGFNYLYPFLK